MIRVLIVDDSATCRLLLATMLATDPEIAVVGEARDGIEAVELTKLLRPDVVTMDVRMPRMEGFEATRQIMIEAPTPIVIVSSAVDPTDVAVSMQALRAGALTILAKPSGPTTSVYEEERHAFTSTLKALSAVKVVRQRAETRSSPSSPAVVQEFPRDLRIVAIAASTGGPAALRGLLEFLPANFPAPILIVQHLAASFLAGFAEWLDTLVPMRVKLAQHDEVLEAGTVYIGAEDRHLEVGPTLRLQTTFSDAVGGFRPSASVMFESVARAYGPSVLAVILTGMGRDGVDGLRVVKAHGGTILAQNAETSVVFGMPGAAVEAGLADSVMPLRGIALRLKQWANREEARCRAY